MAATNVAGIISVDTTWTEANSPYRVTNDVLVDTGAKLTIEPGVSVEFDPATSSTGYLPGTELAVRGAIDATGTASEPITFKPSSATYARGAWGGIRIQNGSTGAVFDYIREFGASYAIQASGANVAVDHSHLERIHYGFHLSSPPASGNSSLRHTNITDALVAATASQTFAGHIEVSDNQLIDNTVGLSVGARDMTVERNQIQGNSLGAGIARSSTDPFSFSYNTVYDNGRGVSSSELNDTPSLKIDGNSIYGNQTWDWEVNGTADLSIPGNWWGTVDSAAIAAKTKDRDEDFAKGRLTFEPVLTGPDPMAPDFVAPETTIDAAPGAKTRDSTPTFTFSSNELGATFECAIYTEGYAPCDSPKTTVELSDGWHVFFVRATDEAGNTDATPAEYVVQVDTTAPETTIDSGPSGATGDSTPTFAFSSSETGSGFECRVDAADFAPCDSPEGSVALADGSHTFEVRATDDVGNLDTTPASRSFIVDTVAPDTTIDSGPSGTTSDPSPTFEFSSSEAGSRFLCRVDSAGFAACGSPKTTAPLTDGSHRFEVRATDSAGNLDGTSASRSFTVDAPHATPDRDADGVPDPNDSCPDQPAATRDGCPQAGATPAAGPMPVVQPQADTQAPVHGAGRLKGSIRVSSRGSVRLTIGRFSEDVIGLFLLKTASSLSLEAPTSPAKRTLRLARHRFRAQRGMPVIVTVRLSRRHRRLLTRMHRLKVRATVSAADRAGNTATKVHVFTLKAPRSAAR